MFECTCCCIGCSVKQRNVKNGFPRNLLVATSVVVIITMCVIPAEARAVEHLRHEGRHERRHPLAQPQEPLRYRKHTLARNGKDSIDPMRLQRAKRFKNATKKIIRKLKNTRRFFNEERRVLNETKEYRNGMEDWLPTINFVDIHFFNYSGPRRPGVPAPGITEKKFMYLMPKLYKSLVEYQEIFKRLLNIEVDFPDDPFCAYNKTRHELITKILHKLFSTIAEIKDGMESVSISHKVLHSITQPRPNKNLRRLETRVDAPQCLKNDYIAFRAYGNLLNNWYSEFRCPEGKKVISSNTKCTAYENKLAKKRDARKAKEVKKPLS